MDTNSGKRHRINRGQTPARPSLSVVIPHYLGDVLLRCVESVVRDDCQRNIELIVVDDGPGDPAVFDHIASDYPFVRVVRTTGSLGFGAACNRGVLASTAELVLVLNNDVEISSGTIDAILDAAHRHPEAALFQPKIRSLKNPSRFDYAGAAGGLIDRLGYPFAHGRIFDAIEEDRGQFDSVGEIHWACGAAMAFRRKDYDQIGGFDEAFYMHMEEIDFAWRLRLRGRSVRLVPEAVVFHIGSYTLPPKSLKKAYLNHRNNWVLLLKNLAPASIARLIPQRLALDAATLFYGLLNRDWRTPLAALLGLFWVLLHLPQVLGRRRAAVATRTVPFEAVERTLYPSSVVIARFLRGVKSTLMLEGLVTPATAAPAPVLNDAPLLSLVIPTWNEAQNLPALFQRIDQALAGVSHEVVIVDDGSPDGTADIAESLASSAFPRVRVLRRKGVRGLSAAVLDGFRAARGRVLAVMDADLQHDPALLPALLAKVNDHDLVIGSRYVDHGSCVNWSVARGLMSRAAAALTQRMLRLSVRDPLSGFFMVRREVVEEARASISSSGWKILLEIISAAPDASIVEVPISFLKRQHGHSKMSMGVMIAWSRALWRHSHFFNLRNQAPRRHVRSELIGATR